MKMSWALVSVSDKEGLKPFACGLAKLGFRFVATSGTARTLRNWNLPVQEVSEWTQSAEILDGRVKTLHPRLHAAILADLSRQEHRDALQRLGVEPISLVIVNLYPFEETLRQSGATQEELIEQIDIGGPTLLRAAAKNFRHVAVVVSPQDYPWVLERLQNGKLSEVDRARLAARAFAHIAQYDALIAEWFRQFDPESDLPENLTLTWRRVQSLRYGENPHQRAAFYVEPLPPESSIATAHQLWGKPLSYNNLLDADAALELVREFSQPAAAIIKHTNPCGAALGETIVEAFERALKADPLSAFGGVVACNRPINYKTAEALTAKGNFFEVVVAPSFQSDAIPFFQKRPGWGQEVRLLAVGELTPPPPGFQLRSLRGGILYTERDPLSYDPQQLQVVTERAPDQQEWKDLLFAWQVVKHVKSNAIVLAKQWATVGIGAGQMSRVGSVRIAVEQAGERAQGAVMASDAFFPFPDSLEVAAAAGVTAVIQPGGSKKDAEVIAAANRLSLAMVFTHIRHFRH